MGYLTLAEFKLRSTMPSDYVDEIEAAAPGFVLAQVESVSTLDIDSRLRKRYACPFTAPYPEAVKTWCARIVTQICWERRGYDPTDQSMERSVRASDMAREEIKEAANSNEGLFDLPLRADTTTTGIAKGAPLSYSEASPYVGFSKQRVSGRVEDVDGDGSYG